MDKSKAFRLKWKGTVERKNMSPGFTVIKWYSNVKKRLDDNLKTKRSNLNRKKEVASKPRNQRQPTTTTTTTCYLSYYSYIFSYSLSYSQCQVLLPTLTFPAACTPSAGLLPSQLILLLVLLVLALLLAILLRISLFYSYHNYLRQTTEASKLILVLLLRLLPLVLHVKLIRLVEL